MGRSNFPGRAAGVPCCCLDGCCPGYTLPDCITLELSSSCCPGDVATVVLTKDTAIDLCPGGVSRPTTGASAFDASVGYIWFGALPDDWCAAAEIGGNTVNVFCRTDPITGEESWWIYIADSDLSHTWYDYAANPRYHQLSLISCDPLLLQINNDLSTCDSGCEWEWQTGCFIAGTRIKTPTGSIRIQDIVIGDIVCDHAGRACIVEKLMQYECQQWLEVYDESGETTGVTADHPFMLDDGITLRPINDVDLGVPLKDGKSLSKVIVRDEPTTVYNLTVSGSHTYVANGFAVHNKGS